MIGPLLSWIALIVISAAVLVIAAQAARPAPDTEWDSLIDAVEAGRRDFW